MCSCQSTAFPFCGLRYTELAKVLKFHLASYTNAAASYRGLATNADLYAEAGGCFWHRSGLGKALGRARERMFRRGKRVSSSPAIYSHRHSGKSSLTCSSSPARSISQRNPSSGMTSDTDTLDTVQLSVRPDPLVGSEIDMTHITNSDDGSAVYAQGISSGYKQLRDTMHICPEG